MLIGVALGLALWAGAIGYLILPGIEYWQTAQRDEITRRAERTSVVNDLGLSANARVTKLARLDESYRDSRDERSGNRSEAVIRFAIGAVFFIIGLSIMAAVLPAWKVLAIVFGLSFLAISMWAWRRARVNWQRFSTGEHRREAILCYVAIPVFAVLGALLLYSVVKGISPASPVRSPSGGS